MARGEKEIAEAVEALERCTALAAPLTADAGKAIKAEDFERAAGLYDQAAAIYAGQFPHEAADWTQRAKDCREVLRLRKKIRKGTP